MLEERGGAGIHVAGWAKVDARSHARRVGPFHLFIVGSRVNQNAVVKNITAAD